MRMKHIQQSVKDKTHKGNKNNRTHYRITKTEQYKTLIGNRKFKLTVRDNNNGITKETLETIKQAWLKSGRSLKEFNCVGTVKALELLK